MKLSSIAVKAFTTRLKNRLALEMDKSVYTVDRWLSDNEENGPLTLAKSLQLIKEETGLPTEQILEEDTVKAGLDK
jgi:hypothetical protein